MSGENRLLLSDSQDHETLAFHLLKKKNTTLFMYTLLMLEERLAHALIDDQTKL